MLWAVANIKIHSWDMAQKLMRQSLDNDAQNTSRKEDIASYVLPCWLVSEYLTKDQGSMRNQMRKQVKIKD